MEIKANNLSRCAFAVYCIAVNYNNWLRAELKEAA